MLLSSITFKINKFLRTYSVTIFIVLVTIGLIFAVYTMTHIAIETAGISTDTSTNNSAGAIDQATINKINSLNSSEKPSDVNLPSGRINPFAE